MPSTRAAGRVLRKGGAATGRLGEAQQMLPHADADSRHRALALSVQHNHLGTARLLLEAGEDPNRYNPVGCHSHSTPLHQAALAGHTEIVRLLMEHGASTDMRDIHFDATAIGWAEHGGHQAIADYLQELESG